MLLFVAFWKDESGAALIEYGLIASLISVIAIASMTAIGDQVDVFFNSIVSAFG